MFLDVCNELLFFTLHVALLSVELANGPVDQSLGGLQDLRGGFLLSENVSHGVEGRCSVCVSTKLAAGQTT